MSNILKHWRLIAILACAGIGCDGPPSSPSTQRGASKVQPNAPLLDPITDDYVSPKSGRTIEDLILDLDYKGSGM